MKGRRVKEPAARPEKQLPPLPQDLTPAQRLARIEKRKARKKALSLTIVVLAIMLGTVFLITAVMREAKPRPRFMFIQNGSLEQKVTVPSLIIRDEQVFTAPSSGLLKPLVTEGSRAARGQNLALIIAPGKEQELKQLQKCERDIVDLQIELIQQGKGAGATAIYAETSAALDSLISLLRRDLVRQELGGLSSYQTSLGIIMEQRSARLMEIDFHDARLTALKQTRSSLQESLGLSSATLVCQKPGTVSYKLDGLESELTSEFARQAAAGQLAGLIESSQPVLDSASSAVQGEPVLRIFASLYQSLVMVVPGNQTAVFPVDSYHVPTIADSGLAIDNCRVIRAEKTGSDTLLVLQTDRRLEWLADRRVAKLELTLATTKGMKVPLASLLDHDKEKARARLLIVVRGVARSCQVEVIDYDADAAIIAAIPDQEFQPEVSTVLVVNPQSIEEGEFIGD